MNLHFFLDPLSSEMEHYPLGKETCAVFIPLLSPVVVAVCKGVPWLRAELPQRRDCFLPIDGWLAWLRVEIQ